MGQYEILQILKQSEQENVLLVKDKGRSRICIQRIINKRNSPYLQLKELEHPNLPRVFAAYEEQGQTIVLEEFINGANLRTILREERQLTERETRRIARQLCDVLSFLHKNNIIHRDIKPDNIILCADQSIKLIDFDIARSVKEGQGTDTSYMGTKGYAPPEQYGFAQTDQRADIYALGKTMAELLGANDTGRLRLVINKCIEIDPKKRYKSAKEVARALELCRLPLVYRVVVLLQGPGKILLLLAAGLGLYGLLLRPQLLQSTAAMGKTMRQPSAISAWVISEEEAKPSVNMELQYVVNQSEEENVGRFYSDGEGQWEFATEVPLDGHGFADFPGVETKYITYCTPQSRVRMRVCNTGAVSLVHPIVTMDFQGVIMIGDTQDENLVYAHQVHGVGGYGRLIWELPDGQVIQPGMYRDFTIYMSDAAVMEAQEPAVTITIGADDMPARTFTVPIVLAGE